MSGPDQIADPFGLGGQEPLLVSPLTAEGGAGGEWRGVAAERCVMQNRQSRNYLDFRCVFEGLKRNPI